MLRRLDDFLIDRVSQPAADWVHAVTGIDSIAQSRVMAGCCAAAWFANLIWTLEVQGWFNPFAALNILISLAGAFWETEHHSRIRRDALLGLRNYRRVWFYPGRIIMLSLLPISLVAWPLVAIVGTSTLHHYIEACDVQPPCAGRVREFFSKLRALPATVRVSA